MPTLASTSGVLPVAGFWGAGPADPPTFVWLAGTPDDPWEVAAAFVFSPEPFGDALTVYQRAIEALQIIDKELAVTLLNLRMTPRDHGCRRVNYHFAVRIAAEASHFFAQLDSFGFAAFRSQEQQGTLGFSWRRWRRV